MGMDDSFQLAGSRVLRREDALSSPAKKKVLRCVRLERRPLTPELASFSKKCTNGRSKNAVTSDHSFVSTCEKTSSDTLSTSEDSRNKTDSACPWQSDDDIISHSSACSLSVEGPGNAWSPCVSSRTSLPSQCRLTTSSAEPFDAQSLGEWDPELSEAAHLGMSQHRPSSITTRLRSVLDGSSIGGLAALRHKPPSSTSCGMASTGTAMATSHKSVSERRGTPPIAAADSVQLQGKDRIGNGGSYGSWTSGPQDQPRASGPCSVEPAIHRTPSPRPATVDKASGSTREPPHSLSRVASTQGVCSNSATSREPVDPRQEMVNRRGETARRPSDYAISQVDYSHRQQGNPALSFPRRDSRSVGQSSGYGGSVHAGNSDSLDTLHKPESWSTSRPCARPQMGPDQSRSSLSGRSESRMPKSTASNGHSKEAWEHNKEMRRDHSSKGHRDLWSDTQSNFPWRTSTPPPASTEARQSATRTSSSRNRGHSCEKSSPGRNRRLPPGGSVQHCERRWYSSDERSHHRSRSRDRSRDRSHDRSRPPDRMERSGYFRRSLSSRHGSRRRHDLDRIGGSRSRVSPPSATRTAPESTRNNKPLPAVAASETKSHVKKTPRICRTTSGVTSTSSDHHRHPKSAQPGSPKRTLSCPATRQPAPTTSSMNTLIADGKSSATQGLEIIPAGKRGAAGKLPDRDPRPEQRPSRLTSPAHSLPDFTQKRKYPSLGYITPVSSACSSPSISPVSSSSKLTSSGGKTQPLSPSRKPSSALAKSALKRCRPFSSDDSLSGDSQTKDLFIDSASANTADETSDNEVTSRGNLSSVLGNHPLEVGEKKLPSVTPDTKAALAFSLTRVHSAKSSDVQQSLTPPCLTVPLPEEEKSGKSETDLLVAEAPHESSPSDQPKYPSSLTSPGSFANGDSESPQQLPRPPVVHNTVPAGASNNTVNAKSSNVFAALTSQTMHKSHMALSPTHFLPSGPLSRAAPASQTAHTSHMPSPPTNSLQSIPPPPAALACEQLVSDNSTTMHATAPFRSCFDSLIRSVGEVPTAARSPVPTTNTTIDPPPPDLKISPQISEEDDEPGDDSMSGFTYETTVLDEGTGTALSPMSLASPAVNTAPAQTGPAMSSDESANERQANAFVSSSCQLPGDVGDKSSADVSLEGTAVRMPPSGTVHHPAAPSCSASTSSGNVAVFSTQISSTMSTTPSPEAMQVQTADGETESECHQPKSVPALMPFISSNERARCHDVAVQTEIHVVDYPEMEVERMVKDATEKILSEAPGSHTVTGQTNLLLENVKREHCTMKQQLEALYADRNAIRKSLSDCFIVIQQHKEGASRAKIQYAQKLKEMNGVVDQARKRIISLDADRRKDTLVWRELEMKLRNQITTMNDQHRASLISMEQKRKAQVLALEARHKEQQEELEAKLKNQEAMLEESLQRERRFLELLNTQPRSGSSSRGGTPPVSVSSPNGVADNTRTVSHPGTQVLAHGPSRPAVPQTVLPALVLATQPQPALPNARPTDVAQPSLPITQSHGAQLEALQRSAGMGTNPPPYSRTVRNTPPGSVTSPTASPRRHSSDTMYGTGRAAFHRSALPSPAEDLNAPGATRVTSLSGVSPLVGTPPSSKLPPAAVAGTAPAGLQPNTAQLLATPAPQNPNLGCPRLSHSNPAPIAGSGALVAARHFSSPNQQCATQKHQVNDIRTLIHQQQQQQEQQLQQLQQLQQHQRQQRQVVQTIQQERQQILQPAPLRFTIVSQGDRMVPLHVLAREGDPQNIRMHLQQHQQQWPRQQLPLGPAQPQQQQQQQQQRQQQQPSAPAQPQLFPLVNPQYRNQTGQRKMPALTPLGGKRRYQYQPSSVVPSASSSSAVPPASSSSAVPPASFSSAVPPASSSSVVPPASFSSAVRSSVGADASCPIDLTDNNSEPSPVAPTDALPESPIKRPPYSDSDAAPRTAATAAAATTIPGNSCSDVNPKVRQIRGALAEIPGETLALEQLEQLLMTEKELPENRDLSVVNVATPSGMEHDTITKVSDSISNVTDTITNVNDTISSATSAADGMVPPAVAPHVSLQLTLSCTDSGVSVTSDLTPGPATLPPLPPLHNLQLLHSPTSPRQQSAPCLGETSTGALGTAELIAESCQRNDGFLSSAASKSQAEGNDPELPCGDTEDTPVDTCNQEEARTVSDLLPVVSSELVMLEPHSQAGDESTALVLSTSTESFKPTSYMQGIVTATAGITTVGVGDVNPKECDNDSPLEANTSCSTQPVPAGTSTVYDLSPRELSTVAKSTHSLPLPEIATPGVTRSILLSATESVKSTPSPLMEDTATLLARALTPLAVKSGYVAASDVSLATPCDLTCNSSAQGESNTAVTSVPASQCPSGMSPMTEARSAVLQAPASSSLLPCPLKVASSAADERSLVGNGTVASPAAKPFDLAVVAGAGLTSAAAACAEQTELLSVAVQPTSAVAAPVTTASESATSTGDVNTTAATSGNEEHISPTSSVSSVTPVQDVKSVSGGTQSPSLLQMSTASPYVAAASSQSVSKRLHSAGADAIAANTAIPSAATEDGGANATYSLTIRKIKRDAETITISLNWSEMPRKAVPKQEPGEPKSNKLELELLFQTNVDDPSTISDERWKLARGVTNWGCKCRLKVGHSYALALRLPKASHPTAAPRCSTIVTVAKTK